MHSRKSCKDSAAALQAARSELEEAKLSHANLPRSEHENLESDLRGGAYFSRSPYVISPEGKILYAYSNSNAEKHIDNTLAVIKKWRGGHS